MNSVEIVGILIDPFTKTISEIKLNKDKDGSLLPAIYKAIGCRAFDKVELEHELRNDLIVDDEGLFAENQKFFHLKKLAPYTIAAGKGLILGFNKNGNYMSRRLTLEEVQEDIVWFNSKNESAIFYNKHIEPLFG